MTISEQLIALEKKFEKALIDRKSIINAIKSKGVDIPDNTLLEDIPKYILMICKDEDITHVIGYILYIYEKCEYDKSLEKLTILEGTQVINDKLIFGEITSENIVSGEKLISNNGYYREENTIIFPNGSYEQENNKVILN